jgi:hypothetical protein
VSESQLIIYLSVSSALFQQGAASAEPESDEYEKGLRPETMTFIKLSKYQEQGPRGQETQGPAGIHARTRQ